MTSVYPSSLDTLATNKQDDTSAVDGTDGGVSITVGDHAQHHNDLGDAVNKIEAELGTNPKGTYANVAARLAKIPNLLSVRAAGYAVTIATPGAAIGGVTMANGDLFLVVSSVGSQTTSASTNGVYQYNGSAAAATRVAPFTGTVTAPIVYVTEGANMGLWQSTATSIVVDTTSHSWLSTGRLVNGASPGGNAPGSWPKMQGGLQLPVSDGGFFTQAGLINGNSTGDSGLLLGKGANITADVTLVSAMSGHRPWLICTGTASITVSVPTDFTGAQVTLSTSYGFKTEVYNSRPVPTKIAPVSSGTLNGSTTPLIIPPYYMAIIFGQTSTDTLVMIQPMMVDAFTREQTIAEIEEAIRDHNHDDRYFDSPSFINVPTAPTAAVGTSTTQIANMAAVQAAVGSTTANRPAARLVRNTDQSIPNATWTTVDFNAVPEWDTDGMTVVGDRLTVVTPGTYVISGFAALLNNGTGVFRGVRILKNGGLLRLDAGQISASAFGRGNPTVVDSAIAGDFYELQVYQDSGGALNMVSGSEFARLEATWTGATAGAAWGNAVGKTIRAAALSVGNGAWSDVPLDTIVIASGVTCAASTVPLTCVTPGNYIFTASVNWASNATGERGARVVHKNLAGTILAMYPGLQQTGSGGNSTILVSELISMSAGDFLQLQAYQLSGGALNISVPAYGTYGATMGMVRTGYGASGGGGVSYTLSAVKTAAYSPITAGEIVRCDSTAGAFTVTLPANHSTGSSTFTVKDATGAAATNNITVVSADGDTIDGTASYILNTYKESATFVSDGTNWIVI